MWIASIFEYPRPHSHGLLLPYVRVGQSFRALLQSRGMTQEDLAEATGISQPYNNQVVNGRKTASARWADLMADALSLSKAERTRLHAVAAKDNGFKIKLPAFDPE